MLQLEMIDSLKSAALETEAVAAVFMYGSFTQNEADKYSDIEFYIFTNSDFDKRTWINDISPLQLFFTNEQGTEVAIFQNMVRGEFHFLPIEEVSLLKSWEGQITFSDIENMILVDKEGLLRETLESIEKLRPNRDTEANRNLVAHQLINNLLMTKNFLYRGESARAHHQIHAVQECFLKMIRLVEKSHREHWETPSRKLEQDIDREWYNRYLECTASLEEDSLIKGYRMCLKLATDLCYGLNIHNDTLDVLDQIKAN